MTVGVTYITRSVDAAFDLVVRDRRAWDKFDLTAEGFYRSFLAILVVLPLNYLIDVIAGYVAKAERARHQEPPIDPSYGFTEAAFSTVALLIQWSIFPLAMIFVLRFMNLSHRYAPLIIAHNWGTVVLYLVYSVVFLLFAAGVTSSQDTLSLYLFAIVFALYYRFYTAQTALDAGWSAASAIAMLGFVLQLYFEYGLRFVSPLWLPATSQ
jgi:hypothetical protein